MKTSKNLKKLLFLFSILLLFGCGESMYKNSLQEDQLNGNVKFIRQLAFTFMEKDGQIILFDTLATDNFAVRFDNKGNETERCFFAANGQIVNICHPQYDAEGKKTAEKTTDTQGNVLETSTFAYNNKGQCIEKTLTDNRETYVYRHQYDHRGNLEKTTVSEQDGTLLYIFTSIYEKNQLVGGRDVFCSFGTTNQVTYKHDSLGREVEMITLFLNAAGVATGQETRTNIYEDDAQGNWIRKKVLINGVPYALFERKIEYF